MHTDSGALDSLEKWIAGRLVKYHWRSTAQDRRLRGLVQTGAQHQCLHAAIRAWEVHCDEPLAPTVIAAALALREDRALVEQANFAVSEQAAFLAALSLALEGNPVHLVYANVPQSPAGLLEVAKGLGLGVAMVTDGQSLEDRRQAYSAPIVLASCRQLMFDYLLDQKSLGQSRGPLVSRLRLRAVEQTHMLLPGLACALIVGAREVLIDQASQPVGISDEAQARNTHADSVYAEAIDIARELEIATHYSCGDQLQQPELTADGLERITVLSRDFGPLWRGMQRAASMVSAAILVLQWCEGTDYEVAQNGIKLKIPIEDLPELEGIGLKEYQQLLSAKGQSGPRVSAPPILKRLSMQYFFPRYVHLSAAGWLLGPRRKELESVYQLTALPALRPEPLSAAAVQLFNNSDQWQEYLQQWLEKMRDEGGNVLLLSPDEQALDELHDTLGEQWRSMLQRPSADDASSVVSGQFLSLTISEALDLDSSQIPQTAFTLVFAGTPRTLLDEALVCHRYASMDALLLASRKDRILQTYGGSLAFFPRSVSAYMRQRRRMEFDERKARMHVAEHDAYVRQTLAFSGDTV